jgi:hypothetical protein
MDKRARLDGWSFNKLAYDAFKEYLVRHPLPNPQAQLDRMLEVGMPHKPIATCCVGNCRRKAHYTLRLKSFEGKQQLFQVCEFHKNWRHPQFRFLISYRKYEGE